ncbi:hypothetical protein [Aeribacillus sp. SP014]
MKIFKGSPEQLQLNTTLRENQLYWIKYIISSMEKRRVAEILFSNGYTIKKVEDVLILADREAALMKDHLDIYGKIDTEYILKTLTKIYQRETLEMLVERLLDKNFDKDTIENTIKLFKK